MVIQTRRRAKQDGLGFTLLELLLTVALLLALLGSVVFNFSTLRAGADLDEGARQFESLIRFAAAQAANSGRTVQLRFGEDLAGATDSTSSDAAPSSAMTGETDMSEPTENEFDYFFADLTTLRVVWEPEPVLQPGIFVDLPEAASMLAELRERIRIDQVKTLALPVNQSTNDIPGIEDALAPMPPISFFPDGSSDAAEIVLASRDEHDFRRVTIRLLGVTGGLRSETWQLDELIPIEWMEADEASAPAESAAAETRAGTDFSDPIESAADLSETTQTNDFPELDFP